MFGFTHDGLPVTPTRDALGSFTATDVSFAPLWVAAAIAADENDFCYQYDRIASALGGPTRDELRDMQLLPARDFEVQVSRLVRVYQDITQYGTVTVTANDEDDAREQARDSDYIEWAEVSPSRYDWELDEDMDDIEVESVERT